MKKIEEQYLGQILTNNSVFYESNLHPSDFSCPQCRALFGTMQHIVEKGLSIDYITAKNENQTLNAGWLAELPDKVPSTANHKYYAEKIKEASNKRRLAGLGSLINDGLSEGKTSEELKEAIERELTDLSTSAKEWESTPIGASITDVIDRIEERYRSGGAVPGITTGFSGLDDMLGGFEKRKYYCIGARPSRGKTALMMACATAADKEGHRVGVISTESAKQELTLRQLSAMSNIDSQALSFGRLMKSDFTRLTEAASRVYEQKIIINDEPNASLTSVVSKAREMVRKDKIEILYVDYGQNIKSSTEHTERENLNIISQRLKSLARELNIPVVCLVQLVRTDDPHGRPHMNNIKGSGQFEQDADGVVLIWWELLNRDEYKGGAKPDYRFWFLTDKARDGVCGSVEVGFKQSTVKFYEKK
jgi:replicative DNA helicase